MHAYVQEAVSSLVWLRLSKSLRALIDLTNREAGLHLDQAPVTPLASSLLTFSPMAGLSYRFAHEAFKDLAQSRCSNGQACSEIITSAQAAKRYARKRGDDSDVARLRAYARSWLALDDLQLPLTGSVRPSPASSPASSPLDQTLAHTLLHPGQGQLVPIINVREPPPIAIAERSQTMALLFSLLSFARKLSSYLPGVLDQCMAYGMMLGGMLVVLSPGIAVTVVVCLIKFIPSYAGYALTSMADRIQSELISSPAAPFPDCVQHPNATVHYHQASLFDSMIIGTIAGVTSAITVRRFG